MLPKKNKNKEGKKWYRKLKVKYKLVLMDDASFEEKMSFKVSRMKVLIFSSLFVILLVFTTIYIIAFTSLREYIPGYTDVTLPQKIYDLQLKTDSIEREFIRKDLYIHNLKRIIEGKNVVEKLPDPPDRIAQYDTITIKKSYEDSLLRAEFEGQNRYNLYQNYNSGTITNYLGKTNFFTPLKGIITRKFDPVNNHYGVDIVATSNEAIKATLDGTVIFSDWTLETGYIIGIQHSNNVISVYKHNSALLKRQGNYVKAGETISILGESGELSTGPHLHFELWHNGKAIDPEIFMSF